MTDQRLELLEGGQDSFVDFLEGDLTKYAQTRQILAKIIGGSPRNFNFETLTELLRNSYGTLRFSCTELLRNARDN